jgi:SulP family sulfate permease
VVTYSVILLTVFVDLIVAVGIGLFVANVMTVMRLSELQAADVKAVTDPDSTDIELTPYEKDMLQEAGNKVLLLYMRGSIIFGASRAISRKNSEVEGREALIVDMTDMKHLGVSSSLALEQAILDMVRAGKAVYVAGAGEQQRKRMKNLGLLEFIPPRHFQDTRANALQLAVFGPAGTANAGMDGENENPETADSEG